MRHILTVAAALTELLTEVLRLQTRAHGVAGLVGMVAGRVVVHVVGRRVLLQLDLPAVDRPEAVFLLFLPRRCSLRLGSPQRFACAGTVFIYLCTSLGDHHLSYCTVLSGEYFV